MEPSAWITYWAGWTPEKAALRFERATITYAELEQRVGRTAGWLRARGVAAGDRVAYLGPNCPELLDLFFACARVGAIFVPLNARMPAPELNVFLELADPRLVVVERAFHDTAAAMTYAVKTFSIGDDALLGAEMVRTDPEADPSAPVLIAFTSGTTGAPKGAVHTNGSVMSNALDAVAGVGITASDEILALLPMFHVAGLGVLTLPALSAGATVTVHRGFDPGRALEDIERVGITLLLVTLPMTTAMTSHPGWPSTDLGSIRALLAGGAQVTEEWAGPWHQRGVPVVQGYGLTEAGPAVTFVPLADVPQKTFTAGKPTFHTRVRMIDLDGREVAPGERGEIVIRSPSVMPGYWRNLEATRDAFRDGWFRTGDVGFIDDEGFVHIVDRMKEIIIVGTSNVYPVDVESVLKDSPAIADAAVVGLPDHELGEVPVAFVVPATGASLDETDVFHLFEGKIATYKHPRHVIFMDALSRTPIGKVEKKALRALARSRLLQEAGTSIC